MAKVDLHPIIQCDWCRGSDGLIEKKPDTVNSYEHVELVYCIESLAARLEAMMNRWPKPVVGPPPSQAPPVTEEDRETACQLAADADVTLWHGKYAQGDLANAIEAALSRVRAESSPPLSTIDAATVERFFNTLPNDPIDARVALRRLLAGVRAESRVPIGESDVQAVQRAYDACKHADAPCEDCTIALVAHVRAEAEARVEQAARLAEVYQPMWQTRGKAPSEVLNRACLEIATKIRTLATRGPGRG